MNQRNTGVIQAAAARPHGESSVATVPAKPIDRLKHILAAESVQEQFKNVLAENSGAFVASIIDLYNSDKYLQACDPKSVVMEALKAASLKLPINKQLGFAWIVPYRDQGQQVPTFQVGYKGYIQLCMRTGAYRYINADVVYEGELVKVDKLTGEIEIDAGKRSGDKKIGYFAFIETLNGFRKTLYMTVEEVTEHAQRYSKSYSSRNSAWASDFDSMAMKTCLRLLLSKFGVMSVEMQKAVIADSGDAVSLADDALAGGEAVDAEWAAAQADETTAAAPQEPAGAQEPATPETAQETLHV